MITKHKLNNFFGEKWKPVVFNFEYVSTNRIEVSSYGRVRSFNRMSDGNILKTPLINGYEIIRLKFFKQRDEATDKRLQTAQNKILKLSRDLKKMLLNKSDQILIDEAEKVLNATKKAVKIKFLNAAKKRTINYHALIHRLVATYFLRKPSPDQTVVAHLDYNKLNNTANNLKWMTPEQNYIHQQGSPMVIQEKLDRKSRQGDYSNVSKLTVTKVMLLKKLLNKGKPIKQLVKQFRVTDTQIFRIKRGENWGNIEAAN